MRTLIISTLLVFTWALSLPAQTADPAVEIGGKVRIDEVHTGTLVDRSGGLLVIQPDTETAPRMEIVPSQINRLEAWRCCNRAKGFAGGALAGVGIALVGGMVLQSLPTPSGSGANMAMAGAVIVGIPLGVAVGGIVGSSWLAPHDWARVEIP